MHLYTCLGICEHTLYLCSPLIETGEQQVCNLNILQPLSRHTKYALYLCNNVIEYPDGIKLIFLLAQFSFSFKLFMQCFSLVRRKVFLCKYIL